MISSCVDSSLRKLTGDKPRVCIASPILLSPRERLVKDRSKSYKSLVHSMQVEPGPVAMQKRAQISEAVLAEDFATLSRVLDTTRMASTPAEGGACTKCFTLLKAAGKFSSANWKTCALCYRQLCSSCAKAFKLTFSSTEVLSPTVCETCSRFLLRVQLKVDPWYNCSGASRQLFLYEASVTGEHTQLCSRLSNYEGLIRFFVENKERVPRSDMVAPLPELEFSIRQKLATLSQLLREIGALQCASAKDEHVKKGLVNFVTFQLTRGKSQFNLSHTLFERLQTANAFSPRSVSPMSSPRLYEANVDINSL